MKTVLMLLLMASILAGCATSQFSVVGKDEYKLTKNSDACAAGIPSSVLNHLRDEATRFCAGRKEVPIEIASDTEMGIPVIRCTSATLRFRCEPHGVAQK